MNINTLIATRQNGEQHVIEKRESQKETTQVSGINRGEAITMFGLEF